MTYLRNCSLFTVTGSLGIFTQFPFPQPYDWALEGKTAMKLLMYFSIFIQICQPEEALNWKWKGSSELEMENNDWIET